MRSNLRPGIRRGAAAATALAVVLAALVGAQSAVADTAPVDPAEPVTYAADSLPTVQIDGVVWDQAIVGNTVYAVGNFATARPAGSAPGVNTVTRKNMLAYNLTTGALITSFAPSFNAQVRSISATPDGSRIYVGGEFTQVSGVTRNLVAGFSTATGALLTSFAPSFNARVAAVQATDSAVYVGGIFTGVGGQSRVRVAAVNATSGAVLPFTATPGSGQVSAFALSPDASQIVIGGSFTSVNGASSPGYGLARLNAGTGAMLPLAVNAVIRNAGTASAITNLSSDASNFYGTGYVYGTGGSLEGAFAASWSTGGLAWMEDCHGDSYDVFSYARVTYVVGHAHYCANIGGFPDTSPRTHHFALAYTDFATRTITKDTVGYPNWMGKPGPTLLTYYPTFIAGTFTGMSQAAWTLTGNASYLVYGGEFTYVNNVRQQGLVRMAAKAIAPNKQGPRISGAAADPVVGSAATGTAQITWPGNWDRDNQTLVYTLYRGDMNTIANQQTVTAPFWNLPKMSFADSKLPPGSTQSYRISATDPLGNVALSDWVSVTIAGTPVPNTAPTALFAPTVAGSAVQVDAAASFDPDGSIVGYAWAFGDGATAAGSTASHTYATAGTFTVSLTVTDNQGATGTVSHDVTVASPPGPVALATDTFTRAVSGGWGAGEVGGAWSTVGSAANFSVAAGVASTGHRGKPSNVFGFAAI